MAITKLKLSNFKSFKNVEIDLNKFNVLIGSNASGKSNFTQIFRFLKVMAEKDLEYAISNQCGIKFLRNLNLGSSENFSLLITSDKKFSFPKRNKDENSDIEYFEININETTYSLSLQFTDDDLGYRISEENIMFNCDLHNIVEKEDDEEVLVTGDKVGEGSIKISNICGEIKTDIKISGITIEADDIIPEPIIDMIEHVIKKKNIVPILNTPLAGIPVPWRSIFTDIAIFDFDPKSSKESTKFTSNASLDENGRNLAIILQQIKNNPEDYRKFSNLLQDLLPFIESLDVESFFDSSTTFLLKEKYSNEKLPALHISDGTINMMDLILAIYFEKEGFIILEEPERNIHPYLLSKAVQMMREASKNKQIIVTTHNPEILKYAGDENIYFVSRDDEGYSTISKPSENEDLSSLLKEIGIDELYIENLLGE